MDGNNETISKPEIIKQEHPNMYEIYLNIFKWFVSYLNV